MNAPRRGVALVAALSLTAIMGLLIAGAVASTTLAARSIGLGRVDAELTAAAELALNTAFSDSDAATRLADQAFGRPTPIATTASSGGVATRVVATRLMNGVVWLAAEARRDDATGARRRVSLVARWSSPPLPNAAIISRGNVRVEAGANVSTDFTGDPDCRADPTAPTVILASGATLVAADSLRMITRSLAPESTAYLSTLAADSSARIVRVRGDTTIRGGSLEGVFLIDGAITLEGPLTVTGLIVARGPIEFGTGAVSVTGSAISFAPPDSTRPAVLIRSGFVRHSGCVISRALRRAIPLRPARGRAWAELF